MIFVTLSKWRIQPTKEAIQKTNKAIASEPKVKVLAFYWTLGRYDAVMIAEAPDAKTVMKMLLKVGGHAATETLVAIPREAAIKLL
jgi:uncharacterized protein with GYD domain